MIPAEILKKVRLIEIKTRHIVNNIFGGEYHSAFKGMGMEFAEVREYYPGDDIRAIDWNVTARTGKPFIKKYDEERELTVMLIVDVSASGFFGTGESLKSDIMIELASILSFSAIKNNDKVGLLLFSDKIEEFIPPKKGKSHVLRVIREMIYHKAKDRKTDISIALEHIQKVLKRKSIIFLLSDFWDDSYQQTMKLINKKHDLINIQILDKAEIAIPKLGMVKFHDAETQKSAWIDTNNKQVQNISTKYIQNKNKVIKEFCKKNKIDFISIDTAEGYLNPLEQFFSTRMHRH
ncbi:MAG TPA: DUF58 domain-containing protein [Candidatus Marinimicrobia bacterium]|jgi:uncharacterized protein (DUF58 family)|nr:DUF58 domain-containing protein [Candidatus Neomarinimicrobiota bacterium]HIB14133.1 DUF58 domain-containing protein [Candidatus Neomarinimicrobiota bacterium]HIM53729.1 DUF58 domain-containing protein [Candidatus Neomarinimicrobiota bacterium]|tara:strand:+ start:202 stop:1077 length:876 start_codon:yes stop_codon:yes gene_type:complete